MFFRQGRASTYCTFFSFLFFFASARRLPLLHVAGLMLLELWRGKEKESGQQVEKKRETKSVKSIDRYRDR